MSSATVTTSADVFAIANSPVLWLCALGVFVVIAVQTVVYVRASRRAAPAAGMATSEVRGAFRAGAAASVGPSLAVVLVALALLSLFGTPAVLVRIGLIGSASTETASAGVAAQSMGAQLGGDGYTQAVFVVAFTAMTLSGGMWMLATVILTPVLKRGSSKLQSMNPAMVSIVPTAALLGAFSMLTVGELGKTSVHVVTVLVSAAAMGLCLLVAHRLKVHWLKEWALGFSIIVALVVAYALHTPGA